MRIIHMQQRIINNLDNNSFILTHSWGLASCLDNTNSINLQVALTKVCQGSMHKILIEINCENDPKTTQSQ